MRSATIMTRGGKREGAGRKPGSPNKELKVGAKREVVRVRLSDAEKAEIAHCISITGESESEFIREAIRLRCKKTR